jgi:hypothetical protein
MSFSPEAQKNCYGVLESAIDDCVKLYTERGVYTAKDMVMSMLSDSQELMSMDRHEQARQKINQAKYILSKYVKVTEPV